jgi:predicted Rossmann fold nucleotide-binding protein DprA/Smf involved in DNA uptake
MTVSSKTQAILLLTAHFTKNESGSVKPLSPKEWGRFAKWLNANALTPDLLLSGDLSTQLRGWEDNKITLKRLGSLLARGSALALSMEKWLRSGLWVITRSDPDYPKRLMKHLGVDSPAFFFGYGGRALLNNKEKGLAVIGSRNVSNTDLDYSRKLGERVAKCGYSVVSGVARGVDETAMLGALEVEGTAIGVQADNLLRACSSSKYRQYLSDKNLVLISPFNPEASFNVGNAMQRNKYIYCLADAAVAVCSGATGGTWNGAKENIKKGWVPMWVKRTDDEGAGNSALVRLGASWASDKIPELDISVLFKPTKVKAVLKVDTGTKTRNDNSSDMDSSGKGPISDISFYDFFLAKVRCLCGDEPQTKDELVKSMEISKTQFDVWIKRAVEDEKLEKLTRPVRYQWLDKRIETNEQLTLL